MPDAQRLASTLRAQTGVWFRRNTTGCQEMEQQKHDDNFSQRNALHSQFLDYFFSIVESKEKDQLQVCDAVAPLAR